MTVSRARSRSTRSQPLYPEQEAAHRQIVSIIAPYQRSTALRLNIVAPEVIFSLPFLNDSPYHHRKSNDVVWPERICLAPFSNVIRSPLHASQDRQLIQQDIVQIFPDPENVGLSHRVKVISLAALLLAHDVVHRQPNLPTTAAGA